MVISTIGAFVLVRLMVVILIFELNCLHTTYSAKGRAVYDSSSRIIFNSITQLYEQGADSVRIGQ